MVPPRAPTTTGSLAVEAIMAAVMQAVMQAERVWARR
jgi:hypothetical protein